MFILFFKYKFFNKGEFVKQREESKQKIIRIHKI